MPRVTIAVPTLNAGALLSRCLTALGEQTFRDFEIVVVNNSALQVALPPFSLAPVRIIQMPVNTGFGVAVNHAIRASAGALVVTLNDDTEVHPQWLEALVAAADKFPDAGMFASQIRLFRTDLLDSAGMLIAMDGSSKQRGRLVSASRYEEPDEVLFPSACAAMYRRSMLDDVGLFDETFFLYCEDTDLGLRARWRGWPCRYVPGAIVEHHYSASAGAASELKARCVERNRLRVVVHNFPGRFIWKSPVVSMLRYYWHFRSLGRPAGLAAASGLNPFSAISIIWSAHLAVLRELPSLLRRRIDIQRSKRIGARDFSALLRRHAISVRQLADET